MDPRFVRGQPEPRLDPMPAATLGELEPALLRAPGMLLIGATGRNNGKTEFVCQLIRRWGPVGGISAAKVTTVSHGTTGCPRGGEGCGVCGSLHQPFCITTEVGGPDGKDTVRMQQAGATPVLWLRSKRESLQEGAVQLLPRLPGPSIVESNRLRKAVAPDLFLLIRGGGEEAPKESAAEVMDLADMVVASDGRTFAPAPDSLTLVQGRWAVKRPATAILLAGGRATRLGFSKTLLRLADGRPLIQKLVEELRPHVQQILISTNVPEEVAFLGLPMIPDERPMQGPLMGIASALARSQTEFNLVVSCDNLSVPATLVHWLFRHIGQHDACLPLTPDGRFHPLFGLYRRSAEFAARNALEAGKGRIVSISRFGASIRYVEVPADVTLSNVNTPEDLGKLGLSAGE